MPRVIQTEDDLDDTLTTPRPVLVEFIRKVSSPLLILGAGGKMGPTLAVLARRAAQAANYPLEVVAVSRFTDHKARAWLEAHGISTKQANLLSRTDLEILPDSANVLYLAGMKFGTAQNPAMTWAVNTLAPAHVAERYPSARIVALSTGNVYPLGPVTSTGATESDPLTPLGEYANAAVARERVFGYFSRQHQTRMALVRLNYAIDLRYGVLVDIARKVWANEPVDVSNGYFNCIWQGDANEMISRALDLTAAPAAAWNLTGPERLRVREVAERFGALLGREAHFTGAEAETALLSNSARICAVLGTPPTSVEVMIRWIAHWLQTGGRFLDKPTHFETRDGVY